MQLPISKQSCVLVTMSLVAAFGYKGMDHIVTQNKNHAFASQLCIAIQPKIQAGATRAVLEYLEGSLALTDHLSAPMVELTENGRAITPRIAIHPPVQYENCIVDGRTDVKLDLVFPLKRVLEIQFVIAFGGFLILFGMITVGLRYLLKNAHSSVIATFESMLSQQLGLQSMPKGERELGFLSKYLKLEVPLIKKLKVHIEHLHKSIAEQSNLIAKQRLNADFGKLAAQVAHDIRSPLSALEMMVGNSPELYENNRLMIRSAVGRIRDITNQLREKGKSASSHLQTGGNEIDHAPQLLSGLVETLITEKRMQFRLKLGVNIEADLGASSYGLFVRFDQVELKRVLSNLVDNAVDALPNRGWVSLTLQAEGNKLQLKIQDNGKGIPPTIIPQLMQEGFTYDKKGGSGLGLYHARAAIESRGGSLAIESQIGEGTAVIVHLPIADPPPWFLTQLSILRGSIVAVMDDDESIHQIWRGRFELQQMKEHGIQLVHFSTPEGLRQWYSKNLGYSDGITFLIDYEILGLKETGLDLIENLGIQNQSILVSSHYEENSVRTRCEQLGVKLLPKGMAGFVPMTIQERQLRHLDAVLIDDDELIRACWESSARNSSLTLGTFSDPNDFFRIASTLNIDARVYVDAHLANGLRGEQVSLQISEMGFSHVYLSTNYDRDYFGPMPWISGIYGKHPPWSVLGGAPS